MLTKLDVYENKVYGGFLGKNIAVRLAAPVEPINWTYDRIQKTFPDIKGYLKPVEHFASDDDINGPVFFVRALLDEETPEIDASSIGRAWLNYTRDGRGMFWWGGIGISTEHTAYYNLLQGITAPNSGSAELNGLTMAEQIGGQIFIDTWGLVFPGEPTLAADMAEKAASVSHDKNGMYGARFMTACISKAFETEEIMEVVQAGLNEIPIDSIYANVVHAVVEFHRENPSDFRSCRDYLTEYWGYDRYDGACHIIPNAGICILSLLYGEGDFERTIEIATMCGWDTDCNAGNVGTILGVMRGPENISDKYRLPINDTALASSGIGYLNIIDIPSFSEELVLYKKYYEQKISKKELLNQIKQLRFNFSLAGSVHGFKTNNTNKLIVRHGSNRGETGNALQVIVDNLNRTDEANVYIQTNYHPHDLDDERYEPVFSPKVYSGQKVSLRLKYDGWVGSPVSIRPYVKSYDDILKLEENVIVSDTWTDVEFILPEVSSSMIDELGFYVESRDDFVDGNGTLGELLIDSLVVDGEFRYQILPSMQRAEFNSITPFTHNQTQAEIHQDQFSFKSEKAGQSLTGHYYTQNIQLNMLLENVSAESFELIFRAKGLKDYYSILFGHHTVSVYEAKSETLLYEKELDQDFTAKHNYKLMVEGSVVTVKIDGELILLYKDLPESYGLYGIGQSKGEIIMGVLNISGELYS